MKFLPETRVARLAGCRLEQKAGYSQHASPYNSNPPSKDREDVTNLLLWMKNKGYSSYTMKNIVKNLKLLSREVGSLQDPERVRNFIVNLEKSIGYKKQLVFAYSCLLKMKGISFDMPRYKRPARLPKVPSEKYIDMLIAHAPEKLSLMLSISKETGLRPIELCNLKVRDIDFERCLIHPSTAKHGAARVLKINRKTIERLRAYISKKKRNIDDNIFNTSPQQYGKSFRYHRNKLYQKLADPEIKQITLYSLRHFYACKLYKQTKNILLVKEKLGHAKIETTLIYVQLLEDEEPTYICETADNLQKASKLIECGFEYVTDIEGVKIFRKRK